MSNKSDRVNKNVSLYKKLVIFGVLFVVFLGCGIWFIISSFNILKEESINYEEKSKVNYSVCLNENEFYDEECLGENMSYIASLIKNVSLKFNYNFNISDESIDKGLEYEVIGKLVIANKDNGSKYFEKSYNLVPKTIEGVNKNGSNYSLNKDIDINYDYYNSLANSFKASYGVDTESYLDVYLTSYNDIDDSYNIPSSSVTSIRIPLSEKAISINMNASELDNNSSRVISNISFGVSNWLYLISGIVNVILAILCMIRIIRIISVINKKKSVYDKTLRNILKTYDRLIVNTSSFPNLRDYNVLNISEFGELLDVRDNLHLPIMEYEVIKHKKCQFYILQDKNLYLYTLDEKDLKNEK